MLPNDVVFMFTGKGVKDWPWRTRVEVQQVVSLSRLWIGADATKVYLLMAQVSFDTPVCLCLETFLASRQSKPTE